jgi:undecaprenyl-diphosphatase
MSGLDLHFFRVINDDLRNAALDILMPFVTDPGPFFIPLTLVAIGLLIWGGRKGRIVVVMALLLLVVSNAVSEGLKLWFQRLRPCTALEAVRLLVGCSSSSFSFPSSHATNVTAQAALFAYAYRPLAIPLFLVAAAVGYSRVYVGVHYPADVIGGVVVGLLCATLFILLWREVERRLPRTVRSPGPEVESTKSQA